MFTKKLRIITTFSVIFGFCVLPISGVAAKGKSLTAVVRTDDGGQHKKRHLKKIRTYLSGGGCRVDVAFLENGAPTPPDTDLEFAPQPIDTAAGARPGFKLLAQARTIEGKTKIGGAILVLAATRADSLATLKGERISFVSKHSSSGYQLPLELLKEAGVEPVDTKKIFVGNHVGAVSMLLHGDTFAAAAAAPLARDWVAVNKELAIVAVTPLVETGGWWINKRVGEEQGIVCAQAIAELTGSQLKAFPAWVGGFNPQ